MAKGTIYRRKRYQCCRCGKDIMRLPKTVSDPERVRCYACEIAVQEDYEDYEPTYTRADEERDFALGEQGDVVPKPPASSKRKGKRKAARSAAARKRKVDAEYFRLHNGRPPRRRRVRRGA